MKLLIKVLFMLVVSVMGSVRGRIERADRDLSIFPTVLVPTQIEFSVPARKDFNQAANEFCEKHNLDPSFAVNLTRALEMKYEQEKVQSEPLISVGVKVINSTEEPPVEKIANISLYDGDTIFDSVYRFCMTERLNIYTFGAELENILIQALQSLVVQSQNQTENLNASMAGLQIDENLVQQQHVSQEAEEEDEEEEPSDEILQIMTGASGSMNPTFDERSPRDQERSQEMIRILENAGRRGDDSATTNTVEVTNQPSGDEVEESQRNLTFERFKLFSVPVKVDNETYSLDFFNGDHLGQKIHQFCEDHGINETMARQPLISAVMDITDRIQKQFPDALWIESI